MGRTKLYDPEDALVAIKEQFWAHGFEGTSLQDLEATTKLPKQTLYREFGDKRQMYLKALADYERKEISDAGKTLASSPDAHSAFDALFASIIDEVEKKGDRRGCFLCNASTDRTIVDREIGAEVNTMLLRWRKKFEDRLDAKQQKPGLVDALLAGYIGLRVLVRAGLPIDQLRALAEQQLKLVSV